MTWIYAAIFILPFLIIFRVKPEDGVHSKFLSLMTAVVLHWLFMAIAIFSRWQAIEAAWQHDEVNKYLSPFDVKEYEILYDLWVVYAGYGWLAGFALTAVAEFVWRMKYKKQRKALGVPSSRFGTVILIIGLPCALYVVPMSFMALLMNV